MILWHFLLDIQVTCFIFYLLRRGILTCIFELIHIFIFVFYLFKWYLFIDGTIFIEILHRQLLAQLCSKPGFVWNCAKINLEFFQFGWVQISSKYSCFSILLPYLRFLKYKNLKVHGYCRTKKKALILNTWKNCSLWWLGFKSFHLLPSACPLLFLNQLG